MQWNRSQSVEIVINASIEDFHDDGFRGSVAIIELCTYTSLFSNDEVRLFLFDALISVICQEKIPVTIQQNDLQYGISHIL